MHGAASAMCWRLCTRGQGGGCRGSVFSYRQLGHARGREHHSWLLLPCNHLMGVKLFYRRPVPPPGLTIVVEIGDVNHALAGPVASSEPAEVWQVASGTRGWNASITPN
ncbi:hypothetical protein J6590_052119 [Homalodisca vitripennis]|nr:hypothetical protein J6590_052119 [Homalodisca vitripennis]